MCMTFVVLRLTRKSFLLDSLHTCCKIWWFLEFSRELELQRVKMWPSLKYRARDHTVTTSLITYVIHAKRNKMTWQIPACESIISTDLPHGVFCVGGMTVRKAFFCFLFEGCYWTTTAGGLVRGAFQLTALPQTGNNNGLLNISCNTVFYPNSEKFKISCLLFLLEFGVCKMLFSVISFGFLR